jgi:hypothetical protein
VDWTGQKKEMLRALQDATGLKKICTPGRQQSGSDRSIKKKMLRD